MRSIFAVCMTLGWVGCAYAETSSPVPSCLEGNSWSVPMRVENNRFVISVKLNGKPVEADFDTGAVTNTAPKKLAKAVGLADVHRSMTMLSPGGNPVKMNFYDGSFDIGGKIVNHRAFVLSDIGDIGNNDRVLMGITSVLDYNLYIDTTKNYFTILDSSACNGEYIPFSGNYNIIELSASKSGQGVTVPIEINGKSFQAFLDTGANSTNINIKTAHALGITDDDLKRGMKTSFKILNGAKVEGYIQKTDRITFDGVTYRGWNVGVSNTVEDVTLGVDILKYFNIFFSPNGVGLLLQSHK